MHGFTRARRSLAVVCGLCVTSMLPGAGAAAATVPTWTTVVSVPGSATRQDASALSPYERVKVAGQVATTALANLPTQAEAGAVMGTAFVEVSAYYASPKVASAMSLPGLRSRIIGEYAGRDGNGFLGVSLAQFTSPAAAAKAMRASAREAGITLQLREQAVPGQGSWPAFDSWAGATATGDLGQSFAIQGSTFIRMVMSPPKGAWSAAQWDRAWAEARALQQRMMLPGDALALPPYLASLLPAAPPAKLTPISAGVRSRDGWLPYGKPTPGFYQSMRPLSLALQYAIAGAPSQLLLQVLITPTSNPALAQEFVAALADDPASIGAYRVDGLPNGSVTASYQGEEGIDAIVTRLVGEGMLIDIACSNITSAPALQPALDACAGATRELALAFRR
ncbi:MAG: hypothetical protein KGP12_02570 [Actinomycetales bacterium]|nr:hypothetical protein [Actinomycetales bacterium]